MLNSEHFRVYFNNSFRLQKKIYLPTFKVNIEFCMLLSRKITYIYFLDTLFGKEL